MSAKPLKIDSLDLDLENPRITLAQRVSPGFRAALCSACAALRCAPPFPLPLRSRFKGGRSPSRCTCYPCVRHVASGM
jgi:hypothetical protein